MNSIKVLIEGYARMNDDETMSASSSTILITSNDLRVLVDPGTSPNLLEKLKEVNLGPDSIDFIFLTHFHIDHVLNIRFFPNTPILDSETIYTGDKESFYSDIIPGTEIQVMKTPGHATEQASLVVSVENEVYVLAQDVFWWMDGKQRSDTIQNLMKLEDPYANDHDALLVSRKKVLEMADWIIPGHGKMFRNPRNKVK